MPPSWYDSIFYIYTKIKAIIDKFSLTYNDENMKLIKGFLNCII
jgi:hypothetical protein